MSSSDSYLVNSFVGENTKFHGDILSKGLLRVDGDFAGAITTDGKVIVGLTGRTESTIKAKTVVIGGMVKGNVYATEKIVVLSSGMVLGNIYAPRLVIEEGVILHGSCTIIAEMADQDINSIVSMYKAPNFGGPGKEVEQSEYDKYNPAKKRDETVSTWNQ
jgi:cytoskeletal protein CcmA (bactofilin family)